MIQGSIMITLPPGVVMRMVACPSQSTSALPAAMLPGTATAATARPAIASGPLASVENPLLGRVIAAAQNRGMILVAAVGNDGPTAPFAFPASYPGVVAVTAVDGRNRILIEAGGGGREQVGVATKTRTKPKKPSQFKVLMLNDDYTPMEFVVLTLQRFFKMTIEDATRVMLAVHQRGAPDGVVICLRELPEGGVDQQMHVARHDHPVFSCSRHSCLVF